jgi:predicted dehydrogenase
VVALSDLDPVRLGELSARCPGAAAYPDFHQLLADPKVDLVAVCVPAISHETVASAAFRARKHVFIEKPLALTLEDCDALVEESRQAESSGIRSALGFNLRSHQLVRQARAIIRSGQLGEIELLRTLWTADWTGGNKPPWHAVRSQGGGALLEIGTHQADLWRWLLGAEVESIRAGSRSTSFDDQSAVFQARMTSGALISAAVSQRSVSQNIVEVFGDRGSLRFSCYHGDSFEISLTGGPTSGAWRRVRPLLQRASRLPTALGSVLRGGDFFMSYVRQWEHIGESLRSGEAMPASVSDGWHAARTVLAALESSQTDAPEVLQ